MKYCAREEVVRHADADDMNIAVVELLIEQCSLGVDNFCRRTFGIEQGARSLNWTSETRIDLDKDLAALTGVTTNAGQIFNASDFVLEPTAGAPYRWLTLKDSAEDILRYGNGKSGAITVTGTWGYGVQVPAAVKMATILWVLHEYNRRDLVGYTNASAGGANAQMVADTDAPPVDVQRWLKPYRKVQVRSLVIPAIETALGRPY